MAEVGMLFVSTITGHPYVIAAVEPYKVALISLNSSPISFMPPVKTERGDYLSRGEFISLFGGVTAMEDFEYRGRLHPRMIKYDK